MKKLLLLITGLLLLFSVEGQILRYSNYTAPAPPEETPDFYDEYDTVYAAFATKPHDTIADLQEALVYSLDTAGYWARMDLFYVFANHDSADAYINWIDPELFNVDPGITTVNWTAWEGFTGDGATTILSTGWNPSSDAVNFTIDDASLGWYERLNISEAAPLLYSKTSLRVVTRSTTDYFNGNINSTSGIVDATTDSRGGWVFTRTASDATALYRNEAIVDSEADVSTSIQNGDLYILYDPSGPAHSTRQISILYVMDGMIEAEAVEITEIINTYMTAIGKNVY